MREAVPNDELNTSRGRGATFTDAAWDNMAPYELEARLTRETAASAALSLLVAEPSLDHSRRPPQSANCRLLNQKMAVNLFLPFLAIPLSGSPTKHTHQRPRLSQGEARKAFVARLFQHYPNQAQDEQHPHCHFPSDQCDVDGVGHQARS